jgi:O-antigen/teichoic acid export membrane protein
MLPANAERTGRHAANSRHRLLAVDPASHIELVDRARSREQHSLFSNVGRVARGPHVLTLLDQAIVSCTNFITTILVARSTLPSEFGSYSIAMSLLFPLFCVHESLISLPYTIQRHRSLGTPAQSAGSSLAHNIQLSAVAMVLFALGALLLSLLGAPSELVAAIWVLTISAPFVLLREFGRRFAFAHLEITQALMLDLGASAIQLASIFLLVEMGWISPATGCAALGLAYAIVAAVWLCLNRSRFSIRGFHVRKAMKLSWSLGKWLGGSQLASFVKSFSAYWILAIAMGTAATGIYAACSSIVAFSNPLVLGLGNILSPKAALELSERGYAGLMRETVRATALVSATMGVFVVGMILIGGNVMRFLYHNPAYDGHEHILVVLALAVFAGAIGIPASNALSSLERAQAIFCASFIGVLITLTLSFFLVGRLGIAGAAYAVLAGNLAAALGRWFAFFRLLSKGTQVSSSRTALSDAIVADVVHAAGRAVKASNEVEWSVEKLGEGYQAHVCAARSPSDEANCRKSPFLVVKLYKPMAELSQQFVRDQFSALARLHAVANNRIIEGWTLLIPEPQYLCDSPPALVMTWVPGENFEQCLQSGDHITPEALKTAARAVAAALKSYWSLGQPYGELAASNMLGDVPGRTISFIDLGVGPAFQFPRDTSCRWYPASQDLAYLLYDLGTAIELGNHSARVRKEMFVIEIVRAVFDRIECLEEKRQLLLEIRFYLRAHLDTLEVSWSPQGVWHGIIRRFASRRIEQILAELASEITPPLGQQRRSVCYGQT